MNTMHDKMIKRCMEYRYLSAWELDFINSLARQIEARPLSDKQVSVLNRINEKVEFG